MWNRLTCVTPAAAVLSLDEAKDHLRVDHSDHDDQIRALIAAAQAAITGPKGTGYAIASSTWRLSLDAFPAEIRIPLEPVTAVTEVRYVDTDGAQQTLTAGDDYLVDYDKSPCRITPAYGKCFPPTRQQPGAVKVLFRAGPEVAPVDLVQAVKLIIAHWYEQPSAVNVGNIVNELPLAAGYLLDRYRDPAL